MDENFPVVECSIETLDRTLYASREVGDLVDTGDYILNTALYYAFGFVSGKYVNSGNKPTYLEDTHDVFEKFYITPAKLESNVRYQRRLSSKTHPKGNKISSLGGHSTSQWNARPHLYAAKNWKATSPGNPYKGRNIPKFGRERVLDQQNLFKAYILPYEIDAESIISAIPKYIRIGKKKSKARVNTRIIDGVIKQGEFISNHPFGTYDYEEVPAGDLISVRMRPVPLIIQGRYEGKFIQIQEEGKSDVFLPYKLELLKEKR
ncbi:type I-D CRISPR-associated protein Cas5/Csc1 [Methanohalophilus sp. DAL1]|jgi:CRISPR-associated protein Csc1|uniref:type I-D CRISPR-associated protein Cas5/Csc1 n=1 Tax=Methanohalophilus sp. DAL1 TaxID=1864608 RepID=UPI000817799F|nr:type I-D CRISPR-associated protein Cas5/Csc1 [Methanohalophilus sp. DAL1]OBZ35415.1 MAG: type I-D CRISPR-associated protein Cas5/Csc1 [Methanohalophilus sp. DAL1]